MVSIKEENLLDTVRFLMEQEKEQHAVAVLKAAIEKSLRQIGMYTPIISQLPFVSPKQEQLEELKKLESEIIKEFTKSAFPKEATFEKILDYLFLVSSITEKPSYFYRKLTASILAQISNKGIYLSKEKNRVRQMKDDSLVNRSVPLTEIASSQEENKYYTTSEAARKLGLSDQTIRRMCEQGKFKGAIRVGGTGHCRIPAENFITTYAQDKKAEMILQRIDEKNVETGDIDEFDL